MIEIPQYILYLYDFYTLLGTVSRKIFDAREHKVEVASKDHDEDKYKRRGAVQWFTRWFG